MMTAEETMETAERPFTREMFMTMTPEEVKAFWQNRQRARRALGREHYTEAVDAETGEVLYTIDGE